MSRRDYAAFDQENIGSGSSFAKGKKLTVNVNKHIFIFNKDINSYPNRKILFEIKSYAQWVCLQCWFSEYLRKKLTVVHILKKSSRYNIQNRLKKKTLPKLLKYRKIPLKHPGRIYGQNTNLISLYCGDGVEKWGLIFGRKTLQFAIF